MHRFEGNITFGGTWDTMNINSLGTLLPTITFRGTWGAINVRGIMGDQCKVIVGDTGHFTIGDMLLCSVVL